LPQKVIHNGRSKQIHVFSQPRGKIGGLKGF